MKASELRLGNYVEYNGMYLQVSGIHSPQPRKPEKFNNVECVDLLCDGIITAAISEIKPIKLSGDIFDKVGFQQVRKLEFTSKNIHLVFRISKESWAIQISIDDVNFLYADFLHQLQNAYYVITEEEIKIKP